MSDTRPIGVFDSGVGGLSVVRELQLQLPNEDLLYFADTSYCPYGPRPAHEVQALALAASRFLIEQQAKLIVVACNTASIASLELLRRTFRLPFVGIVPAVKPAAAHSRRRRIGVLATCGTLQGLAFDDLVQQFATDVEVWRQPCPGLVELVERGETEGPHVAALVASYVAPLLAAGVDTVVLGCTHFPFLRPVIERAVGSGVAVIDTGRPVARQVQRVLRARGLASPAGRPGRLALYTSGRGEALQQVTTALLGGMPAPVVEVELQVPGVAPTGASAPAPADDGPGAGGGNHDQPEPLAA